MFCKEQWISDFPFPQYKRLFMNQPVGDHSRIFDVYLIPVINQPLSSNRYYVIKPSGKHKGKAYVSLKEEDKGGCWFCCQFIKNAKPKHLDPIDANQQFEFSRGDYCIFANTFSAKSVAPDSYPPAYIRKLPWNVFTRDIKNCLLTEAAGIDISLRGHLPELNISIAHESSEPEVLGKYYPFMFVDDIPIKNQVEKSLFYEMTLERRWQRIFTSGNSDGLGKNTVTVDVVVTTEGITIDGKEAEQFETNVIDEVVRFNGISESSDELQRIGLSSLIVERMIWEEKYEGVSTWMTFGFYVLVERFVLKRMDGSLVLTYDFKHNHQVKNKWE